MATGAGAVTAAAVLGLLTGIGHHSSTLWRPLNAAGHAVLGSRADDVWGFAWNVTPVGVAVVFVMSAAAGVAAAWLTSSRRPIHGAMAALGVALAGYLVHAHLVARSSGGLAALLSIGELRALYATTAVALVVGMRYAFASDDRALRG